MNHKMNIERLQRGENIIIRGKGNSMTPRIMNGDWVEISPVVHFKQIQIGDAVYCKVRGFYYDGHLVTAIDETKQRVQISNNHGHVNGWTKQVYGRIIRNYGQRKPSHEEVKAKKTTQKGTSRRKR